MLSGQSSFSDQQAFDAECIKTSESLASRNSQTSFYSKETSRRNHAPLINNQSISKHKYKHALFQQGSSRLYGIAAGIFNIPHITGKTLIYIQTRQSVATKVTFDRRFYVDLV